MANRSSRLLAAVSYLLPIVGPVALFLLRRDDGLVQYHCRQSLGLASSAVAVFIAWAVVGWGISLIPYYGFLLAVVLFAVVIGALIVAAVLWIAGMVNSVTGQRRPLPIVGRRIDRFFGSLVDGAASRADIGGQHSA